MDFRELISRAHSNKVEAKSETLKRYSTQLPPPKKVAKAGVKSDAVRKFLARKEAEEQQKAEEARKKREELLAIRSKITKNNKKAKIMASRTKDNDFSKIKLTEDEVEAKKQREVELLRLELNNKVDRMKARIEMEEREKLLPRKRKRKTKDQPANAEDNEVDEEVNDSELLVNNNNSNNSRKQDYENFSSQNDIKEQTKVIKKPRPPPPPSLSFYDLLQVAAKKQYEPVEIPVVEKDDDDERPLTKKARRLLLEEENRVRRKLAAEAAKKSEHDAKVLSNLPNPSIVKQLPKIALKKSSSNREHVSENLKHQKDNKEINRKNVNNSNIGVSHKSESHRDQNKYDDRPKQKKPDVHIPQGSQNGIHHKKPAVSSSKSSDNMPQSIPQKKRIAHQPNSNRVMNSQVNAPSNKIASSNNHKKDASNLGLERKGVSMKTSDGKNKVKVSPSTTGSKTSQPVIKQETIAEVEQRIRNEMEQKIRSEMERQLRVEMQKQIEKLAKETLLANSNKSYSSPPSSLPKSKTVPVEKPGFRTNSSKNIPSKSSMANQKPVVRPNEKLLPHKSFKEKNQLPVHLKPGMAEQGAVPNKKPLKNIPGKVQKPAFHPNPYLEPPRRLLESQRSQKPPKRRIESDDDDDDDEMSDFIDDNPVPDQDDDYSKYIKEIFRYDRNVYQDDDDDEVMETSYAEQEKEERRSARIGYLEDLEDMKMEEEEKKRKLIKKKKIVKE